MGETIGHYEVLELIGEGGMGRVYLARDTMLDRRVAIKVLTNQTPDGEEVARFEREAKALAALNHPNILSIHEFGRAGAKPYVVMELLDGRNVRELLNDGPLPQRTAVGYAIEIAHGLAAAHEKGISHRDLKPENIFVTGEGRVKILDFGLAGIRLMESTAPFAKTAPLTTPGAVVGTLGYMSPEQVRGDRSDHRADLFAFGSVIFELLTGRRPWQKETMVETLHAILKDEPPLQWLEEARVPPALTEIVGRCLEKNVLRRFQSARDVAFALQNVLAHGDWSTPPRSFRTSSTGSGIRTGRRRSIAVLPFRNIGSDTDMEYFSDGVTEDIINALTQVNGLDVAARTSSFAFKGKSVPISEIGQTLRVNTVLEGSVRRAGNRLRITAQLSDVMDGYHLWSERYDRELDDVFAIQDDIAVNIAQKLRIALSDVAAERGDEELLVRPATRNLDAYELYLKARFLVEQRGEGLVRGLEFFNQAIAADPEYALAYAGLAETLSLLAIYSVADPRHVLPRAKQAAERALQLDGNLVEAHNAIALVSLLHDWNWEAALASFNRALELNPAFVPARYWKGLFSLLFVQGDEEAALKETARALELDPIAALPAYAHGLVLIGANRCEEAVKVAERVLARDPAQAILFRVLGIAHLCLGNHEQATAALERGAALSMRHPWLVGDLGVVHSQTGNQEEARRLQEELLARSKATFVSPVALAVIPTALGERDEAVSWLERAYEQRDPMLIAATTWPTLTTLHTDTRVRQLFAQMGVRTRS